MMKRGNLALIFVISISFIGRMKSVSQGVIMFSSIYRNVKIITGISLLACIITLISACSGHGEDPITVNGSDSTFTASASDSIPVSGSFSTEPTGILGAFNLVLSPDTTGAQLSTLRLSSLSVGESFLVSGTAFFTINPCLDCLKIDSINLNSQNQIVLGMSVKHPFKKGDPSGDPSPSNRLDLDLFDLALVIHPQTGNSQNFPGTDVKVYNQILQNADGYTGELDRIVSDHSMLPYKICYENQDHNRFEMGTDYQPFDLVFNIDSNLNFNLFLTMGYGYSAKPEDRLNPTYYVPEFNRKAAWKVEVIPPDDSVTWTASDSTAICTVTINVFDWNHGVQKDPYFPDPGNTDKLSAESDIKKVTLEIPGMTQVLTATTTDNSSNGWDDPVTYTARFANTNLLGEGCYPGIVKVLDSRPPGSAISSVKKDTIGHVQESNLKLKWYDVNEFATYQAFNAVIVGCRDTQAPQWIVDPGGITRVDAGDGVVNIYWSGALDYPDLEGHACPPVSYLIYYDQDTDPFDSGYDYMYPHIPLARLNYFITDLQNGNQYCFGVRCADGSVPQNVDDNTVKLCCTPEDDKCKNGSTLQVLRTFGSFHEDKACAVTIDNDGYVYVTGTFTLSVDFGGSTRVSNGRGDAFLCKYNSAGNLIWAQSWGTPDYHECGYSVAVDNANDVYVVGETYMYSTINAFLVKCNSAGSYQWQKVWSDDTKLFSVTDSETSNGVCVTGSIGNSMLLRKHDNNGGLSWSRTTGDSCGYGVDACSNDGSIYVAGEKLKDACLWKYNSEGTLQWSKSWGSSLGTDTCYSVVTDPSRNAYVTGCFTGNQVDFWTDEPDLEQDRRSTFGDKDAFIVKYNPEGGYIMSFTNTWGGPDSDFGLSVTRSTSGNLYVSGSYQIAADFMGCPVISEGKRDAYLCKFNSVGSFKWVQDWGGTDHDIAASCAVNSSSQVFSVGQFLFQVDFDGSLRESNGEEDAFLVRVSG
jgi:hypothetical protein